MTALVARLRRLGSGTGFPGIGFDRVWIATVAILVAVSLADAAQGMSSLRFVLGSLASTAPYLVGSIAIAAYAGATGADALVARAFSGRVAAMVVLAALFGGLSPFCSCGVIPLIAALLAMGVPLAPVMAFWLASPVIDPAQFVLTAGTIGTGFAVAKTLAAVGLGLFGGFGTLWLVRAGFLADPLRPDVGNGGCGGAKMRNPRPPVWRFWHEPARVAKFRTEALKATHFLVKWLTLAFLLESLMLVWLPAETVAAAVGGEGLAPIVIATLVGVPAYLNGYAALPLVSGLMAQGMAPGAGLAFLVAGGVSSLPAAIAVFALVKRPVFALYLGFALSGSLIAGVAFQALH